MLKVHLRCAWPRFFITPHGYDGAGNKKKTENRVKQGLAALRGKLIYRGIIPCFGCPFFYGGDDIRTRHSGRASKHCAGSKESPQYVRFFRTIRGFPTHITSSLKMQCLKNG